MLFDPKTIVKEKLRLWGKLAVTADPKELPRLVELLERFISNQETRDRIVEIVEERRRRAGR